jgi:hypothetical protein
MVSVSRSSPHMVGTYEHAISVPPTTCPQLAGRRGAQGNPDSPNSPFPMSTILEDPGSDGMSPTGASQDELGSDSLKEPAVGLA